MLKLSCPQLTHTYILWLCFEANKNDPEQIKWDNAQISSIRNTMKINEDIALHLSKLRYIWSCIDLTPYAISLKSQQIPLIPNSTLLMLCAGMATRCMCVFVFVFMLNCRSACVYVCVCSLRVCMPFVFSACMMNACGLTATTHTRRTQNIAFQQRTWMDSSMQPQHTTRLLRITFEVWPFFRPDISARDIRIERFFTPG